MSDTAAEQSPLPAGGTIRPITRWGEEARQRYRRIRREAEASRP